MMAISSASLHQHGDPWRGHAERVSLHSRPNNRLHSDRILPLYGSKPAREPGVKFFYRRFNEQQKICS